MFFELSLEKDSSFNLDIPAEFLCDNKLNW